MFLKKCLLTFRICTQVADDKENKDKDLGPVGFLSSNQRLRSEEANDEPTKTPEHQIYQKQGHYSELFTSSEEGQSHGFLSSVSPKFVCLSYLIQSLFDLFHNVVFVRIGYFSRFGRSGRFEQFN